MAIVALIVDFSNSIPKRLKDWTPERLQGLSLVGQGCSLCLKPGAVECCKFQPIFYNFHLGELKLPIQFQHSWRLPLGMRPRQATLPYPRFCDFFKEREGRCSIWSQRPPECVSYFCEGDSNLKDSFQKLNSVWHQYEAVVAQMAMVELGFDKPTLNSQIELFDFSIHPTIELSEEDLKRIWQDYYGRELEFYRSCYSFADKLDCRTIEEWL